MISKETIPCPKCGRIGGVGMVTVASLFDGIGGTPLSAQMAGAVCLWASEIEKFPINVTKYHFPDMLHMGDITKINGAEVEPVDIIVGGSPCQDLSVAGKRKGLKHEDLGDEENTRSGLFMEQVRIVKEMRAHARATNQPVRPRYVVWENVPGAFSSNACEDFRAVVEEFAKIADETVSIPRPPRNKWLLSGSIMGKNYSIAWRTVDAQYWGVAQRRRRIYLVVDFGGGTAPEILFEREGVSGYSAEGFRAWQGAAADAGEGFGETGTFCLNDQGGQRMALTEDVTNTLRAESHHPPIVFENHSQDSRYTGPLDISPTVSRKYGTGGNNVPLVARMQSFDGDYSVDGIFSALKALDYKDATDLVLYQNQIGALCATDYKWVQQQQVEQNKLIANKRLVRRLTPLECERLQGYPDNWTDIPGASDTARYKALGNSFAIPNAYFVINRCVKKIEEDT